MQTRRTEQKYRRVVACADGGTNKCDPLDCAAVEQEVSKWQKESAATQAAQRKAAKAVQARSRSRALQPR